jgi:Chromo (CHRromatin Organisation MOdifier) domain
MGPVALLDFFEPSSRRLPPSLEQTTVDDYEEDESTSIQSQEEESNQMQQQHPVETILHSKFESSGQQKYLIRWMGDYKDSWQPKGNITSDIIEDFDKRKMQEMANKHLAEV